MKIRRKNEIRIRIVTAKIAIINQYRLILLCIVLSLCASLPLGAQCGVNNTAFNAGERVVYDMYFNWKFIWTKAGEASLDIDATRYNNHPAYRFNLLVTGNKKADFYFKLRDTLTSIVSERMEPLYFRKGAEEEKRYTVDEATFFYKEGVHHVKQKRTYLNGDIRESEQSDSRCIHDMLSILGQIRCSYHTKGYKAGDRIDFPVATGRRLEEQTLICRGKKNFKAENDVTYKCVIFSLVKMNKHKKEEEVVVFYVTDDENLLPVRIDMFFKFGSAKAFLREVKGNRHPLTSIVTE